jgi:hydroxyacylglutathione hydrolase
METWIYPIPTGVANMYAVKAQGVVLIDAGGPQKISKIKDVFHKAGIKPEDVRLLVLTHGHWDHIGSARDIIDWAGCEVLLHQRDLHLLNCSSPVLPGTFSLWGKVMLEVIKPFAASAKIPHFEVDITPAEDEFSLHEYGIPGKIIHTPGHTPGSLSVLLEGGEAFVGDLAMNEIPMRLKPGLPIFGDDLEIIKESWRRLQGMGVQKVYPGHGKPFSVGELAAAVG